MRLVEYTATKPKKWQPGLIEGVLICGQSSKNKRYYTDECLQDAVNRKLYEKVKVFCDHLPNKSRSVRERFGELSNTYFVKGEGIRGNLSYLESHEMASKITEDLDKDLGYFGLSHDAVGEMKGNNVIRLERVNSVDLVADAATCNSLLESMENMENEEKVEEVVEEIKVEEPVDYKHLLEETTNKFESEIVLLKEEINQLKESLSKKHKYLQPQSVPQGLIEEIKPKDKVGKWLRGETNTL
jgi:hypothetical protein